MNECLLISSNDHIAWQNVSKTKGLKAVGRVKCISLVNTLLKGNDDYLIAGLSQVGDANMIKITAFHKQYKQYSNDNAGVYVFEGIRLGPSHFQYKLRLEVQGKHPRVIHEISREFEISTNIYELSRNATRMPLFEAQEIEAKTSLVYPYKITSWSNSYSIELPGHEIWASNLAFKSDTKKMMMMRYATSDVSVCYSPDGSIPESRIYILSHSVLNTCKSILSTLMRIRDALLASRDLGRDVIITDIVSEMSLRLNLMKLYYSHKCLLYISKSKDGLREKMIQRSRQIRRQQTWIAWSSIRACLNRICVPDIDFSTMPIDMIEKAVLELGYRALTDKESNKICEFLKLILEKADDKAGLRLGVAQEMLNFNQKKEFLENDVEISAYVNQIIPIF